MNEKTYTDQKTGSRSRNVLVIGCGKMAGALLSGWLRGQDRFTAVEPGEGSVPDGVRHVRNQEELAGETFDTLVVGIKPQMLADILPAYTQNLANGAYVLSMAAGVSAAAVSRLLNDAPTIRIMPNLPAAIEEGVSALFAQESVSGDQRDHAEHLARLSGQAHWMDDEDRIDRFTAVAGSGPGYVFELLRAYVAAAEALGFEADEAREMVLATVIGTARMAEKDDRSLEDLRNAVTSPNGTTAAGLKGLADTAALDDAFSAALRGAYDRAVELR
jgi:pyrroline-5-carboxylate reductase